MAMAAKLEGAVGPVKGSYERKGRAPITTRPCEHAVLFKDKNPPLGGRTRIVTFHGDYDGRARITKRGVGKANKGQIIERIDSMDMPKSALVEPMKGALEAISKAPALRG